MKERVVTKVVKKWIFKYYFSLSFDPKSDKFVNYIDTSSPILKAEIHRNQSCTNNFEMN